MKTIDQVPRNSCKRPLALAAAAVSMLAAFALPTDARADNYFGNPPQSGTAEKRMDKICFPGDDARPRPGSEYAGDESRCRPQHDNPRRVLWSRVWKVPRI